jgi:hypothetical protein
MKDWKEKSTRYGGVNRTWARRRTMDNGGSKNDLPVVLGPPSCVHHSGPRKGKTPDRDEGEADGVVPGHRLLEIFWRVKEQRGDRNVTKSDIANPRPPSTAVKTTSRRCNTLPIHVPL